MPRLRKSSKVVDERRTGPEAVQRLSTREKQPTMPGVRYLEIVMKNIACAEHHPLCCASAHRGVRRAAKFTLLFLASVWVSALAPALAADRLVSGFSNPPPETRPWVYWFVMDGNLSREGITADFEAMQQQGIGGVIMMEVDAGIPRGKVDFMSPEWQDLFAHAVREAERLGLQMTLNAGPGWTGSGGPWVKPEQSMQHLVASATNVTGPRHFEGVLPRPKRRPAFFGDGGLPPELERARNEFYADFGVLAFPTPAGEEEIRDLDEKALYVRAPYSSQPGVKPFLPTQADYPQTERGAVIHTDKVVDLSGQLDPAGRLLWDVPAGNWTILRFGRTSTGANTRPAPAPGTGLESDKFDPAALDAHFDAYVGTLLRKIGPQRSKTAGWKYLHIDSWEMGAQNWTKGFEREFRNRRGYDLAQYLPTLTGRIVQSREITERFLWDIRQTAQELVIQNHAQHLKELGRRHGFGLSIEPYDMNPCADLDLGAVADVPMCEFWLYGFDSAYSVIEAASIAHTRGKPIVAAEAFTSNDSERWQAYPESMKALGDWAFCRGVNRIVFHRYQHQPWLDRRPGMTMGPYGVHWERTQTWWDMSAAYHEYLARAQYMLRAGLPVIDVCLLAMEGAPHVFRPAPSATYGNPPDNVEYAFDGCAPDTLINLIKVRDGRLVLPDGMSYQVLVLPESPTMTPQLLGKIKDLVASGATIIGQPPSKSPSLSNYPDCDAEMQRLAKALWGNCDGTSIVENRFGRGRVIWKRSSSTEDPLRQLLAARWIWYRNDDNPQSSAPLGTRSFRRQFKVRDTAALKEAKVQITADNAFKLFLNGNELGRGDNFTRLYSFDLRPNLHTGTNVLRVEASNLGEHPNPAGVIAAISIAYNDGQSQQWVTDTNWEAAADEQQQAWSAARDLGAFDAAPWLLGAKHVSEKAQYGEFAVVKRTLRDMGVTPDFESDKRLRFAHRKDGATEIYFVANPLQDRVDALCTFRVDEQLPELWDPVLVTSRKLPQFRQESGRTIVPLKFEPYQSYFVVFRDKSRARPTAGINFQEPRLLRELDGPWEVRFDPNWGGPAATTFDRLESWTESADERIKYYSGKATYRHTFELGNVEFSNRKLFVDLGKVKNMARVRVNGKSVGVAWCPPWRVEITKAVRTGTNNLEIEVANLWPNRLIKDASLPPEQRLTSTTWNPFKADSPLLDSGLLGPVKLTYEPRN